MRSHKNNAKSKHSKFVYPSSVSIIDVNNLIEVLHQPGFYSSQRCCCLRWTIMKNMQGSQFTERESHTEEQINLGEIIIFMSIEILINVN